MQAALAACKRSVETVKPATASKADQAASVAAATGSGAKLGVQAQPPATGWDTWRHQLQAHKSVYSLTNRSVS